MAKAFQRRAAASLLLLLLGASAGAEDAKPLLPVPPVAGRFTLKIKSGGLERSAQIHVPQSYKPGTKPPLVLLFHGGGGSAASALANDGWAAKADQEGFLVAAPEGLGIRPGAPPNFRTNPAIWNSGQYPPRSPIAAIDDIAFVRQLLDELKAKLPYDEGRVFSTGHSNGGGMTFRVAAELSERIAAVGMVAGRMAVDRPNLKKPMPTLYIVGTKDPLMPLAGGEIKSPWAGSWTNRPVAAQLEQWATAMGCAQEPKPVSDQNQVRKLEYPSKTNGPVLTVLYLEGHGHHWPGAKRTLPERLIGPIVSQVDATSLIREFFKASGAKRQ